MAALLLWFIIGLRGGWLIKAGIIVIIIPLSIMVWNGIESYQGWPTPKSTPQKFLFLGAIVHHPDKQRGYEGEIFIWLLDYTDDSKKEKKSFVSSLFVYHPKNEPRAHTIPYSKELEKEVLGAIERGKRGIPTIVERIPKQKGEGQEGDGKREDGHESGHWTDYTQEFLFYPLPPPKFPEKMRENQ